MIVGSLQLLAGQRCPGAHRHLGQCLGDGGNAGEPGLGAQRDLQHRQAARCQRSRQRHGDGDASQGQHRDHHRLVDQLGHAVRVRVGGVAHLGLLKPPGRPAATAPVSAPPIPRRRRANRSRPMPWSLAVRSAVAGKRAAQVGGLDQRFQRARPRRRAGRCRRRAAGASGPPSAASGVTWIAAGTLPEAPDMRPSVTSATLKPLSCSTPSGGRELVQLGHAVGLRALEADHGHEVAVELAGLEGGDAARPGRRRPRPAPR